MWMGDLGILNPLSAIQRHWLKNLQLGMGCGRNAEHSKEGSSFYGVLDLQSPVATLRHWIFRARFHSHLGVLPTQRYCEQISVGTFFWR